MKDCPICKQAPVHWVGEDLRIVWGHCGVECKDIGDWNNYAINMALALSFCVEFDPDKMCSPFLNTQNL